MTCKETEAIHCLDLCYTVSFIFALAIQVVLFYTLH